MRASVAVVCAAWVLSACSDGIGRPIRAQIEPIEDRDADGERDDDDDRLDEQHCRATSDWPESYAADELELLDAINALREGAIRCGDREVDDLPALRLAPALRCSARLHSLDMVQRRFEGRTNPDGDGPRDRMRAAGYRVEDADESLVLGERTAAGALSELLDDWDDCMNLATRQHAEVGIGRYEDRWTLDFASD